MNLHELIDFHVNGAEAYAITPGANEEKNKDISKHYTKRAKWHRDAVELLQAAQHQGEPEAVAFNSLAYGAKFKYEAKHGTDSIFVKIGHNLVAAWDERMVSSSWVAQGLFSAVLDDSNLSMIVYLVRDQDIAGKSAPVAWFTKDHLTDRSATTWDSSVADRWREKGWPVGELFGSTELEPKT